MTNKATTGVKLNVETNVNVLQGDARMLLFSPTSRILYFTTTLSHSVQAYSLSTGDLLPPLQAHPSPPNVLVISKRGDVLLTASPIPPTVFIQDLRVAGTTPMAYFPREMISPVSCADFHNHNQMSMFFCLFVLGFQDGTLGLYRLAMPALPLASYSSEFHALYSSQLRQPIKVASIQKLHKPAMGGIAAVAFIPGYKARLVSIGHDGKCRLVDFENGGEVLRTWRVCGSPTCLSVASSDIIRSRGRREHDIVLSGDGIEEKEEPIYEGIETLIAISTQPGKVLIFNILGLLIHEISVEAAVVAIEWVGDMSAPLFLPSRAVHSTFSGSNGAKQTEKQGLHMLLTEYENDSNASTGTVRRTSPPQKRSAVTSPLPFRQRKDLFSPSTDESMPTSRRSSRVLYRSPDREVKRPRKLYSRPRIVTETFQMPTFPFASLVTGSLTRTNSTSLIESSIPVKTSSARRWPQMRTAPDFPLMSGILSLSTDGFNSSTQIEAIDGEKKESDIWATPPTSRKERWPYFEVSSPLRTMGSEPRSPTRRGVRHRRKSSSTSSSTPPPDPVIHQLWSGIRSLPQNFEQKLIKSPIPMLPSQSKGMTRAVGGRAQDPAKLLRSAIEVDERRKTGTMDALEEDNQKLRNEVETLKQEFNLLREAMLVSRT